MSCTADNPRRPSNGRISPNGMATPAWMKTATGPLETVWSGSRHDLIGHAATPWPPEKGSGATACPVPNINRRPGRTGAASAEDVDALHGRLGRIVSDGFASCGAILVGAVDTGNQAADVKTRVRRFNLAMRHPTAVHAATGSELVLTSRMPAIAHLRDHGVPAVHAQQCRVHQLARRTGPQVRVPQTLALRARRVNGRTSCERAGVVHHDNLIDRLPPAESRRRRST